MRVLQIVTSASVCAAVATASFAATVVEQRQAVMKQIGQAMKDGAGLASGQTAWDPAKARAAMNGVAGAARKAHGMFPAGSDKDAKSAAAARIWAQKADFDKRMNELAALAASAGKAPTPAAFSPAFQKVGGTCKSCHDLYRKKSS